MEGVEHKSPHGRLKILDLVTERRGAGGEWGISWKYVSPGRERVKGVGGVID